MTDLDLVRRPAQVGRRVGAFLIEAAAHTVFQRLGLLEYFFEHEMREPTFLKLAEIHFKFFDLVRFFHVRDRDNLWLRLSPFDDCYFFVVQIYHLVGVFNNRRSIRTKENLILTYPDHQRATFPGSDNAIGVPALKHCNGIRSNHLV